MPVRKSCAKMARLCAAALSADAALSAAAPALPATEESRITIANSDKIVMAGSSYVSGCAIRGKHFTDIASAFSDYQFYNFGVSGDTLLDILNRVRCNQGGKVGLTGIRDWNATYAVLSNFENNLRHVYINEDFYFYNLQALCSALEALGIKPILSLEYSEAWIQPELDRLAHERGYLVINEGALLGAVTDHVFPAFNANQHPSTRTAASRGMVLAKHLAGLPRPRQSIKIFRPRPGAAEGAPASLVYDGIYDRLKKFCEITVGNTGLADENARYFDRMHSHYQSVPHASEYEKLLLRQPVALGDHALVEVTLPCTARGLEAFRLGLAGTGVGQVFVKRCTGLDQYPAPGKTLLQFGIDKTSAYAPQDGDKFKLVSSGNDYDFKVDGTVYTVIRVVGDKITTDIEKGGKVTSGLNLFDTDLPGLKLRGSFGAGDISDPYYAQMRAPVGDWLALERDADGCWAVPPAQFSHAMQYDKLGFLLAGRNMTLTDVFALYAGAEGKDRTGRPVEHARAGRELLADTLLDDNCTAWKNISSIPAHQPLTMEWQGRTYTEKPPAGINTIRVIAGDRKLVQDLPPVAAGRQSCDAQIRVLCRYFPPYIDSDEKYDPAAPDAVGIGSYDFAELQVEILQDRTNPIVPPAKALVAPVALWWHEVAITVKLPRRPRLQLILSAPGRPVQVAEAHVVMTQE